jgi:hypothetical protein
MSNIRVTNVRVGDTSSPTTDLLNLSPDGIAKAFVHYDQRFGPTIRNSLNVASVNDTAQGHYKVTLSNAMANSNYALSHSGSYDDQPANGDRADLHYGFPSSTTLYENGSKNTPWADRYDNEHSLSTVHGDLA